MVHGVPGSYDASPSDTDSRYDRPCCALCASRFRRRRASMIAALFWKRSTKYGALCAALWVAGCLLAQGILEAGYAPGSVIWQMGGLRLLALTPLGRLNFLGMLPVVPMIAGSSLGVIIGSLCSRAPSAATLARYFGQSAGASTRPSVNVGKTGSSFVVRNT